MIEARNLTKRFGTQIAVDDVSFTCEPGSVTGFLGPNGAGKSTTMRVICGLARASSGTSTLKGRTYREFPNPAREIGVMLDASAQHKGRTGRETLSITAKTICADSSRIERVLDRVGLDRKAARKRVGNYSLGMRQRLGLAQVLIGEPDILILDEPANGLDPKGIIWMRELLREFADEGGTVLLSSHLLLEVEAVADRLLLINEGKLVAQGTKTDLLSRTGSLVSSSDMTALKKALETAGIEFGELDESLHAESTAEAVGAAALAGSVALTELRPADGGGLEELFLSLTASDQEDRP